MSLSLLKMRDRGGHERGCAKDMLEVLGMACNGAEPLPGSQEEDGDDKIQMSGLNPPISLFIGFETKK